MVPEANSNSNSNSNGLITFKKRMLTETSCNDKNFTTKRVLVEEELTTSLPNLSLASQTCGLRS